MTPTEALAYDWLIRQGCTQIEHNPIISPDFFTDKGNFEVKLATGKVVQFARNQIQTLQKTNSTILIFSKGAMEPSAIINAKEMKEIEAKMADFGFSICVPVPNKSPITAEISDDLEMQLRMKALKIFGGKKGSLQAAIEQAISEWVK